MDRNCNCATADWIHSRLREGLPVRNWRWANRGPCGRVNQRSETLRYSQPQLALFLFGFFDCTTARTWVERLIRQVTATHRDVFITQSQVSFFVNSASGR